MSKATSQQDNYGIGPDAHYQTKCKCGSCGLHFVVCSWHEGAFGHSPLSNKTFCPGCGHQGVAVLGVERVELPICMVVPGSSGLAEIIEEASKFVTPDDPEELDSLIKRHQRNKQQVLEHLASLEGYELKKMDAAL